LQKEADKFLGLNDTSTKQSPSTANEISLTLRLLLYFSSWAIALFTTAAIKLGLSKVSMHDIDLIPFFPLGLTAYIPSDKAAVIEPIRVLFTIGYIVHGIVILATPNKSKFIKLFVLFVIVLILNVAGCQNLRF